MRNIAIIPARSGSKGLPDKNIKLLNGKPLIAYTIEAAKESRCFDTIMVSTDSQKYADIAVEYGADVPFLRTDETASDTASSWAVVREVLEKYKDRGEVFDSFALLQPTTPLRQADDIKNAYQMMLDKNAGAIVSVCEAEHSITLYNTLPEDQSFVGFLRDPSKYARQMEGKTYRLNGAIYFSKVNHFYENNYIYDSNCYAAIMPSQRSVDIDNELDFRMVEFLMNF